MPEFLPSTVRESTRVMTFVDGENLAIRYGEMLGEEQPKNHVIYRKDVYVWSRHASRSRDLAQYIRRYYYTSSPGDHDEQRKCEEELRKVGIEAPRIFHKPRSGRSKRVDITLATEMLAHAHRKNYDIAVLVAGDEDYVPLVEAVKGEGRQVVLWFVTDGLSRALLGTADHFWNLDELLFRDDKDPAFSVLYF